MNFSLFFQVLVFFVRIYVSCTLGQKLVYRLAGQ